MVKLSNRLAFIAERVPAYSRLADIGSDHALLPTALAQQGAIQFAVAGELNEGPYHAAWQQVQGAGLQSVIDVRRGDGLSVLSPCEVDVVVIAGMGGSLIAQILENGSRQLDGVRRLILQPNVGAEFVRRWLVRNDWALIEEAVIEEEGNTYEICIAERSDTASSYNLQLFRERVLCGQIKVEGDALMMFGPHLIDRPSSAWFSKWDGELQKLQLIWQQISRSASESASSKKATVERQIQVIREVVECLRMDRQ